MIQVEFKGETKKFSAEEISSMVLTKMIETASAYLGKQIKDAVVTVPDDLERPVLHVILHRNIVEFSTNQTFCVEN
jgi:hypothetical protein